MESQAGPAANGSAAPQLLEQRSSYGASLPACVASPPGLQPVCRVIPCTVTFEYYQRG